jgi:hypothetical protein
MIKRHPKTVADRATSGMPKIQLPARVPKLTPTEHALVCKQRQRRAQNPSPPLCLQVSNGQPVIAPAHHDEGAGWLLLQHAMGTASPAFLQEMILQLAGTSGPSSGKVDEEMISRVNAMLAGIKGIAPRDETEGMLAAQMVAIHSAMMRAARRLAQSTERHEQEAACNMVSKLARTYATQVEALKKYRSAGEQVIRVQHQYVTVHEGGQAIVGNVEGRDGGRYVETTEQPHVLADAAGGKMRGKDPQEKQLQRACDAERALPTTRRKIDGSPKGQQERAQARKIHRQRNR